ncbi:type II toxin-antitoxin system VapC family toxin [Thioalkalivibrio paradoxus]|uniref:Ribonuclease VapC n=1 Tax=Thioalkalivibrio paradoxus ARh 1 TaxID=713585 RepID=W0DRN5_9GAMM|nr:type II toxin-antitoxin system VapC family toxin [Thioalkalivibrio paradoxus]AHE99643.1 plasmid stabilization protein [Thioalkalivibrio paradoxus ARh 1]
MIVLDTNVVFEAMRPEPDATVRAWLNDQAAGTLYLSSVPLAELLFGIRALPAGKRKNLLDRALTELLELFKNRVLPFDTDAARHYADLTVTARNGGRGFPTPDGYIAAIAASKGFIVASRDTSPYEASGVTVINPWGAMTERYANCHGQRPPPMMKEA